MTVRRFFVWTLPVLLAGTAAVGLIGADELGEGAQMPAPAASDAATVPGPQAAPEQSAAAREEAAPEQPAAASEEEAAGRAESVVLLPAAPPRSLQTLVDERRDMMRERRNAMFDAFSGRRASMSPWMASYDDAVERYRDAMRAMHRQQRDYQMLRHDSWMDAMCPWSKPQRDWSRQRSILMQLEQIDRQEARDAWRYGQPFAFTGPTPW